MDKMKQWVALTAVGVIAVLAAGWFLLVSPKRSEAADVQTKVAAEQSRASGLETQLAMLKAQAKNLPLQQAKLAAVVAKIPDNPALPALIRGLTAAADGAGVELVSLSPGTPVAVVQATTRSVAPSAAAGTSSATTPSSSMTTGTSPTAAAGAVGSAAAGSLQAIPLTVNVVGSYFQVEQFFDQVENLARAFKVTGFTLSPGANPVKPPVVGAAAPVDDGRSLQAAITANVYMALGRITTATTPAAPAAK